MCVYDLSFECNSMGMHLPVTAEIEVGIAHRCAGIFFVYGSYLLELGLFADPFPVKFFLELMPMLLIRCSYASIVLFW